MTQITVAQAAALTGRAPSTIRWWIKRQHLPVAGRGPRNCALLDSRVVLDVERAVRARDMRSAANVGE